MFTSMLSGYRERRLSQSLASLAYPLAGLGRRSASSLGALAGMNAGAPCCLLLLGKVGVGDKPTETDFCMVWFFSPCALEHGHACSFPLLFLLKVLTLLRLSCSPKKRRGMDMICVPDFKPGKMTAALARPGAASARRPMLV